MCLGITILYLAFEHPGNAHCIVGLLPLVQMTSGGELFGDLSRGAPLTRYRIGATRNGRGRSCGLSNAARSNLQARFLSWVG